MKSRLPFALALSLPVSLVLQPTVWVNVVLALDVLTEGSLGLSKTPAYTRYVRLQVELWRPPREAIPLPEVHISNATPAGLHALTHGWTRPAVVRNALKDTPAVQAWSDPASMWVRRDAPWLTVTVISPWSLDSMDAGATSATAG